LTESAIDASVHGLTASGGAIASDGEIKPLYLLQEKEQAGPKKRGRLEHAS
jgi:hypothetical protein